MADTRDLISTHILDLHLGKPAAGVPVVLCKIDSSGQLLAKLAEAVTDADGRIGNWPGGLQLQPGVYQLQFQLQQYLGEAPRFFPLVQVAFYVTDISAHHHVPLLLSPYGYSTYRGS